jgi:drug/metabolite transporter (DMT)-like permease
MSLIWGVPYLFIKVAIEHGFTPVTLAWARVVLAAVILLSLARRAGSLGQLRGRWRPVIAYAVVELAIPLPMIAVGERHVSSSLAAIIIAAVPLIVALLALRFDRDERVGGRRLAGLVAGLFGVALLVGVDASGTLAALLGAAALLLAAVGYAAGPMLLKRFLLEVDPRASMGASLAVASVILTPLVLVDAPSRVPSAGALGSAAVLGIFCTAIAFVLMAILIGEVGTSRAMVVTYINPVIAVALGVTLLDEHPGAGATAGLLLILAGSWVSTDGRLPRRVRPGRERVRAGAP